MPEEMPVGLRLSNQTGGRLSSGTATPKRPGRRAKATHSLPSGPERNVVAAGR